MLICLDLVLRLSITSHLPHALTVESVQDCLALRYNQASFYNIMAPGDDNSSDNIFLTVIKHATELKVDWHAVAKDTGIKYHNNA